MDLPTPAIDFASPGFWLAVLQIIWIDILLSGDSKFTELPELMSWLTTSSAGVLCHTLRYD